MSDQPFGDIPLFREIQRLLAGEGGPVNLEIARQIAGSIVAGAGNDPTPGRELTASYQNAVITAQQLLAGYTRRSFDEPPSAAVITRATWVDITLRGWSWLMEEFASRLTTMVDEPEAEGAPQGLEAIVSQIVPLMMGLQVGSLTGHLGTEALFRHELPIPREDDGKLFLVASNAERTVENYSFDHDDFLAWVALRDTGRQLIVAASPWVHRYFRSALSELIASVEIDTGSLESRMMDLQSRGIGAMQSLAPEDALPVLHTERHRGALERLRALFAVFEGYATHAATQVASESIKTFSRIEEGMARHSASPSQGKQALASILGISLDKQITAQGATFCAAVVKLRGMDHLNRVWDAPDNLPSVPEIKDPFAWMERVLDA